MKYILIEMYRRMVQMVVGLEMFELPGLHAIRVGLMRTAFSIGRGAHIGARVRLTRQHHMTEGSITIGKGVTLANGCSIDYSGHVTIADNVTISSGVVVLSHKHDTMAMAEGDHKTALPAEVTMGYGAWIGTNAIILPSVHIGEYAVVGAGAVVTKNVAPYALVGGNPARLIKDIRVQKQDEHEA